MNKDGEIIVIEDDPDDQEMLQVVFRTLKVENKIIFFPDGLEAVEYLQSPETYPFLILSDINLPALDGFELRERIFQNKEISKKCIPYLFFTTAVSEKAVSTAYALSAQGYFKKPYHFKELLAMIDSILTYWRYCYSPNRFKGS